VACIGLQLVECVPLEQALLDALGADGRASAVLIEAGCEDRCPPVLAARPRGSIIVDTADGVTMALWGAKAPLLVELDGIDHQRGPGLLPTSDRAVGVVPYQLGHCGLTSGIDVDGSWWDPFGFIPDESWTINGAAVRVILQGDDTAFLQASTGTIARLVRHAGPRHLPGCV
jgi:hypothetical protein